MTLYTNWKTNLSQCTLDVWEHSRADPVKKYQANMAVFQRTLEFHVIWQKAGSLNERWEQERCRYVKSVGHSFTSSFCLVLSRSIIDNFLFCTPFITITPLIIKKAPRLVPISTSSSKVYLQLFAFSQDAYEEPPFHRMWWHFKGNRTRFSFLHICRAGQMFFSVLFRSRLSTLGCNFWNGLVMFNLRGRISYTVSPLGSPCLQ